MLCFRAAQKRFFFLIPNKLNLLIVTLNFCRFFFCLFFGCFNLSSNRAILRSNTLVSMLYSASVNSPSSHFCCKSDNSFLAIVYSDVSFSNFESAPVISGISISSKFKNSTSSSSCFCEVHPFQHLNWVNNASTLSSSFTSALS